MGYDDRDYFREQRRVTWAAPSVGPASKVFMGLLILGFMAMVIVDGTASPAFSASEGIVSPFAGALSLSDGALIPGDGSLPRVWQLVTSWLIPAGILALLFDIVFGAWLIGAAVEEALGWRRYAGFLLLAQLSAGVVSAVVDPLLLRGLHDVTHVYSMGAGPMVFAVYAAHARLNGSALGLFGMRVTTMMVILVVLGMLISVWSYAKPQEVMLVSSVPGLLCGALFGWFAMGLLIRKKAVARKKVKTDSDEEDYIAYASRFDPDKPPPTDETRRRTREKIAVEKQTKRLEDEQAAVDALLARISRDGIGSLNRSEKAFLERVSKRKREEAAP